MTTNKNIDSAWEETSWKGHRRAQHRAFFELSFEDKLKAVEEMADFAREMIKARQHTEHSTIHSEAHLTDTPAPHIKPGQTH